MEGLADMPPADARVRAELEEEAARFGWQALHDRVGVRLIQSRPRAFTLTIPQRLSRALEVYRVSGQSMTALRLEQAAQNADAGASGQAQLPYTVAKLAIAPANRQVLHERIAQRFQQLCWNRGLSTRS